MEDFGSAWDGLVTHGSRIEMRLRPGSGAFVILIFSPRLTYDAAMRIVW
jgi:hypothetical protein